MEPPSVAAPLYALPPDAFVPAREALARQLSEAHDPLAPAVRKLRRPVGLAWVLNGLAASEKEKVAALLTAGDRLRAAQRAALEEGRAGGLREAEDEVRNVARTLRLAGASMVARAGREAAAPAMARVELLLRALATAPGESRAQFQKGLLEREPDLAGDPFEGLSGVESLALPEARSVRPEPTPTPTPTPAQKPEPAAAAPRPAQPEARAREREEERARRLADQARRREAADAQARAQERARLVAQARRAIAEAERERDRRRSAVEAARQRLEAARAELEEAEREAERRRERLAQLEGPPRA